MIKIERISWNRWESSTDYERIPFNELNSTNMDKLIISTAQIMDIQDPITQIEKVTYMCSSCGSIVHLDRPLHNNETKNYRCIACNRKGPLVVSSKTFKDTQQLTLGSKHTKKRLTLFLEDDLVSYDNYKMYDTIQFKGILRAVEKSKNKHQLIIQCREIRILSRMEETEPTAVTEINRESPEYRQWVTDIQNRDKVCQICGGTKHLEAHHIYAYKNNPELRTDRGNGVLLCTFCHGKFHSYYGKDVTPADLVKFIFEFKGL